MARRRPSWFTPLAALALVCALSLGLRAAWLGQPCREPCHGARDHLLIFDEDYYVNAARVIAGVRPPAGLPYAQAPSGDDPNAEHPQLAKLAVAGMIELVGDGPLAWRLPSLVMGTLALLGLYALVRAGGGSPWLAAGAAALMAADNLLVVHGRIFTLDIYALTGMLWAAVAYLRGHPLLAGALLGVAADTKMVAPYLLAVLVLYELLRWWRAREAPLARLLRLAGCTVATGAVLIGLLAVLDQVAPPYDNSAAHLVTGGPFAHLGHQFSYAAHQVSPHGPQGIASYPWQWLYDFRPITYLNIDPARPAPGLYHVEPPVHFLGVISPPILLAGLIGLALAGIWTVRGTPARLAPQGVLMSTRRRRRRDEDRDGRLPALALAWFAGTYLPFLVLSLGWQRTSYLYYMVIVMPGLYLAAVLLAARIARHRWVVAIWALTVVAALVLMYPFTPVP